MVLQDYRGLSHLDLPYEGANMRRIDRSEFRDEEGIISFENRVRATLQDGFGWYGSMQAQDDLYTRMGKTLGNEHLLLCNVIIPGTTLEIPVILLSPQGVRVLLPSAIKGVFRAKGEEWLKFSGRGKRFSKARPNLQASVQHMADTLVRYLRDRGFQLPEIEAVLVFVNPRTHVDTANPSVRIVLADAIDHFSSNLQQFQPIMDLEDIREISESLLHPQDAEADPEAAVIPVPTVVEEPILQESFALPEGGSYVDGAPAISPKSTRHLRPGRLPFSQRQLILLGMMGLAAIAIIGVFAILVVATTFYGY